MSSGAVLAVVVVGLVVLAALLAFATARRRDERQALATSGDDSREESTALVAADHAPVSGRELERSVALEQRGRGVAPPEGPTPVPFTPPDEETLGITRRQVLNRGIVSTMGLAVTGFGASMLAMLWPSLSGGFGAKIRAGKVDEILEEIADKKEPFYLASGRFYINPYPKEAVAAAKGVPEYSAVLPGYEAGFVALYQKCVHLGCRVPWCTTSQWFECPCHGSQYNRVGEKKGGPAPRGLDRFALSIEGGNVMVDTGEIIDGPPIGTDTTGQEAEGPNCIGAVSSH